MFAFGVSGQHHDNLFNFHIDLIYSGYGHYGVVVTTYRGGRWLIHKGHNFSKHSDTVITSAAHMSKRWEVFEKKKVKGVTVGDYMKAAGRYYHPICDNALHGAKRMMLLGSKKSLKTMI